jgi:hypothetical protein
MHHTNIGLEKIKVHIKKLTKDLGVGAWVGPFGLFPSLYHFRQG